MYRALLRPRPAAPPTDAAAREELLRRCAAASFVLLRNRGALPLERAGLRKVAVLGPNAAATAVQGGGSSRVRPKRCQTLIGVLRAALGPGVEVLHEAGCRQESLPGSMMSLEVNGLMSMGACDATGQPHASSFARTKVESRVNDLALGVGAWLASQEWFRVGLMPLLRPLGYRQTTPEEAAAKAGARGESAALCDRTGARLQEPPAEAAGEALMQAAEAAAAEADAVVLVLGTHGFWELEGVDQPHMQLPGRQDELARRVIAAARGPVVAVLNVGSPK